jgi:hypothetical protein
MGMTLTIDLLLSQWAAVTGETLPMRAYFPNSSWQLVLLACISCGSFSLSGQAGQKKPLEESVRTMLGAKEFKDERVELVKLGPKAFPVYHKILAAADSNPTQVSRVFLVLNEVRSDRKQFLELTVVRLADMHDGVRWAAAKFLGQIGSANDASPLVALLNDPEESVALNAAKSLGVIGGQREKLALIIWSKTSNPAMFKELAKEVKNAIKQIDKRLKKERKGDAARFS